jgi:hypothetical protein
LWEEGNKEKWKGKAEEERTLSFWWRKILAGTTLDCTVANGSVLWMMRSDVGGGKGSRWAVGMRGSKHRDEAGVDGGSARAWSLPFRNDVEDE